MQSPPLNRPIKTIVIAIAVIVLGLVGFSIWRASQFHVVSTEPGMNNFSTAAPFFKINFNRQLSSNDLVVSSRPDITSTQQVSGKTLIINISHTLDQNTSYVITVTSISDMRNEKLTNLRFTFQPKNIDFNKLPKDQQDAILQRQAAKPKTRDSITYIGLDTLMNYGLSAIQNEDLKQAIFQYSQSAKKDVSQVTIPVGEISPVPHNPESSSMTDAINFTVQLDKSSFSARVVYGSLTQLELFLMNPQTGQQLYDSGTIDISKG